MTPLTNANFPRELSICVYPRQDNQMLSSSATYWLLHDMLNFILVQWHLARIYSIYWHFLGVYSLIANKEDLVNICRHWTPRQIFRKSSQVAFSVYSPKNTLNILYIISQVGIKGFQVSTIKIKSLLLASICAYLNFSSSQLQLCGLTEAQVTFAYRTSIELCLCRRQKLCSLGSSDLALTYPIWTYLYILPVKLPPLTCTELKTITCNFTKTILITLSHV